MARIWPRPPVAGRPGGRDPLAKDLHRLWRDGQGRPGALETAQVTLAEALARVSGPADARANARAVYLLRLEKGENGAPPTALVYHIDLMKPQSYFLAQTFQMHDKDTILFANSSANVVQKLVGMVNQLFSPASP
jgi:polysaccharide export outer membrane protein